MGSPLTLKEVFTKIGHPVNSLNFDGNELLAKLILEKIMNLKN